MNSAAWAGDPILWKIRPRKCLKERKERKGKVHRRHRHKDCGTLDCRNRQQYLPRNAEKEEDISRWERHGDSDGLMYVLTVSLFLLSLSFPQI